MRIINIPCSQMQLNTFSIDMRQHQGGRSTRVLILSGQTVKIPTQVTLKNLTWSSNCHFNVINVHEVYTV
ncbi:hypothetical protein LINPERHAP2_LOCUS33257 [Linum perenne]